jgi:hypothetical protein
MNQPGEIPMDVFKALKRFEYAIRKDEFKGGKPPEERETIEAEYQTSRDVLIVSIRRGMIKALHGECK